MTTVRTVVVIERMKDVADTDGVVTIERSPRARHTRKASKPLLRMTSQVGNDPAAVPNPNRHAPNRSDRLSLLDSPLADTEILLLGAAADQSGEKDEADQTSSALG